MCHVQWCASICRTESRRPVEARNKFWNTMRGRLSRGILSRRKSRESLMCIIEREAYGGYKAWEREFVWFLLEFGIWRESRCAACIYLTKLENGKKISNVIYGGNLVSGIVCSALWFNVKLWDWRVFVFVVKGFGKVGIVKIRKDWHWKSWKVHEWRIIILCDTEKLYNFDGLFL